MDKHFYFIIMFLLIIKQHSWAQVSILNFEVLLISCEISLTQRLGPKWFNNVLLHFVLIAYSSGTYNFFA